MLEDFKKVFQSFLKFLSKDYNKYIIDTFEVQEKLCSECLDTFAFIYKKYSVESIEAINECYGRIYPKAIELIHTFSASYYTKNEIIKKYAQISTEFLMLMIKYLSTSPSISSNLYQNTILDVLENQEDFTIYTENGTVLDKLKELNRFYKNEISTGWNLVCQTRLKIQKPFLLKLCNNN